MVKKYIDNESLSWEERYSRLEAHYIEETTELVEKLTESRRVTSYLMQSITNSHNKLTEVVKLLVLSDVITNIPALPKDDKNV